MQPKVVQGSRWKVSEARDPGWNQGAMERVHIGVVDGIRVTTSVGFSVSEL